MALKQKKKWEREEFIIGVDRLICHKLTKHSLMSQIILDFNSRAEGYVYFYGSLRQFGYWITYFD